MIWGYAPALWIFLALPILALMIVTRGRRSWRELKSFGKNAFELRVRSLLRDAAMLGFLVMTLFAAADPRLNRQSVTDGVHGLDVVIAFDISRSMLARDVPPSRLERSIAALRQIVMSLNDSRFSLVIFKGDATLAVPMTEDRAILDLWASHLGPGLSTVGGTNIEAALRAAGDSFPEGSGRKRAIILISDGDSLSGRIDKMERELSERNLPVYVLAVGSSEGSTIELADGSHVKDSRGRPALSRVDTRTLRRVADNTGGALFNIIRPGDTGRLISAIQGRGDFTENRSIDFVSFYRYRLFLVPGMIFLFLFLLIRIVPWRNLAVLAVFSAVFATSCDDLASSLKVLAGNMNHARGQHQKSILNYLHAGDSLQGGRDVVLYNLANVYYSLGEEDAALQTWRLAESITSDKDILYRIAFNQGVFFYQRGRFHEAYDSFRRALELNPEDVDAKINLEESFLGFSGLVETDGLIDGSAEGNGSADSGEGGRLLDYVRRKEVRAWEEDSVEFEGTEEDW